MSIRITAGLSALAAAGAIVALAPATAHATTTPAIGHACGAGEIGNLRYTTAKQPTVCANTGRDISWVRTGAVDPVTRHAGTGCSGAYAVAGSPTGKALLCADGRWVTNP
ncbi:hypothetical protein ACWDTI_22085 [Gordonia sp. NPDC003424]